MGIKRIIRRLPRLNLIIGKKQIVIAGLTLILGTAIYINYLAVGADMVKPADDGISALDAGTNYGDAAFVSGGQATEFIDVSSNLSPEIEAYFAKARLDKQESRDEAKEFMAAMYNGGDETGEYLEVLARDATQIKNYIESETKIETLLRAMGFDEVLCYLSDKGANIIVRTNGLEAEDAAKIKSTLLSEIEVLSENITIVEIN